jgi:hypothetical protein
VIWLVVALVGTTWGAAGLDFNINEKLKASNKLREEGRQRIKKPVLQKNV